MDLSLEVWTGQSVNGRCLGELSLVWAGGFEQSTFVDTIDSLVEIPLS